MVVDRTYPSIQFQLTRCLESEHMFENGVRLVSLIHLKAVDIASANGQIEDILAVNVFQCWIAKTVGDVCNDDP